MDITKKGTIQPIVSQLSKVNIKERLLKNLLYALLKDTLMTLKFELRLMPFHYTHITI